MDPYTGVLPGLKVMVDRATWWEFAWQQTPLTACPQQVKDGVEDGTKVGGARSAARSSRRQNWDNPGPRRVGQGRCRRIECSSYGPFGPDQRSFKTEVNFSNTLLEAPTLIAPPNLFFLRGLGARGVAMPSAAHPYPPEN